MGPEIEEANACLFGLQCAKEASLDNLIVEGDCLPLNQKLKDKKRCDNFANLVVSDILTFSSSFSFISWSIICKAGGNSIAHDLAHWQLLSFGSRLCLLMSRIKLLNGCRLRCMCSLMEI